MLIDNFSRLPDCSGGFRDAPQCSTQLPVSARFCADGAIESPGLAFSDYRFMQTHCRSKNDPHFRTGTPAYVLDPERLREVIVQYLERRVFSLKQIAALSRGTYQQRLARVQIQLAARREWLIERLQAAVARFMEAKSRGDSVAMRKIDQIVCNWDSQLRIQERLPAIVASTLWLSYRLGWRSSEVAHAIQISPVHVRQILHRCRLIAERLGFAPPEARHSHKKKVRKKYWRKK